MILPLAEDGVDMGIVHELHTLGELDGQSISRQSAAFQYLKHVRDDGVLQQLCIGHIYTDMEVWDLFTPVPALRQRSFQYPQPDGADELGLLQNGDKFCGRHGTTPGGGIAQQAFRTIERIREGTDLWLINKGKPGKTRLNAPLQILFQLQSYDLTFVVLSREKPKPVFSVNLCVVQSTFRILVKGGRIGDRIFPKSHTTPRQSALTIHALLHLRKNRGDVVAIAVREQNDKTISIDPIKWSRPICNVFQSLCYIFKDSVTGIASLLEVDGLKIVDADHK